MNKFTTLALSAAIATFALPLHATESAVETTVQPQHANNNLIDKREHRQKMRIRQGVESGALTKPETKRLVREQARIRKTERAFRSDGELTPRERFKLQRRLTKSSAHIYREKHDRQRRR